MSTRDPSLRKAAVLVASLDADTADLLLAQMPPEQAEAVRREVLGLDDLDPAEQQVVIDEFFRIGPMVPESEPPGLELDDDLLRRLELPHNVYVATAAEATHEAGISHRGAVRSHRPPFSFLHDAEPEALVPLLEREHPQAIALVLSHLPPERAGHVLARLPATMQADVIRRLVDLEETDPHVLRDVEGAVEAGLHRRQPARRRVAGEAAVSAILSAAEGTARRQILNNLATHDRTLAHKFTPSQPPVRQFTFTELCLCPVETLARVVRSADRHTSVLALAGASVEVVEELLARLRPDEARWLSQELTHLGPLRLFDIDRAQEDLAELAGQLYAERRLPGVDAGHLTAVV